MRHELKNDHTTDIIKKSRMHVFKFLTQLAPSVEKTESSWVQVSL